MDGDRCSQQVARATVLLTELSSAAAKLLLLDDDCLPQRRKPRFLQRLRFEAFILIYKHTPFFRRHMRMSYESFCTLHNLTSEHLGTANETMSNLRGGKVTHEVHLYATIRYLAGGSYLDIVVCCGISVSMFYVIIWRTIDAINAAIEVSFPSTVEECGILAAGFQGVSNGGIIHNCVGAVDGYHLAIQTPAKKHAQNVRSFFSGHYKTKGMNIQACCDSNCRFTYVAVGGPGVTKDRKAVEVSGLLQKIEQLPQGYVVVGDCAYQATERLVPIFGGELALQVANDNFNYFASQLRIRIEMAFGMMTRKWGILQRPLTIAPPAIARFISCMARLHNFCIDDMERLKVKPGIVSSTDSLSTSQLAYMEMAAQADHEEIISEEFKNWSRAREDLVKAVRQGGFVRPFINQRKRKQVDQ